MGLRGTKVENDLIQEIRVTRGLAPNDTLCIDTTSVGVLKLMLRYEKIKLKNKELKKKVKKIKKE